MWIGLILVLLLWRQYGPGLPTETARGDSAIAEVFAQERSGLMVEVTGRVDRLLPEDLTGIPQQRFILKLKNGHILLILNDLEYSDPVPLVEWDTVGVRGEYEWTAQGGKVSRTHRDPGFGLKHGWIEHKGKRYD